MNVAKSRFRFPGHCRRGSARKRLFRGQVREWAKRFDLDPANRIQDIEEEKEWLREQGLNDLAARAEALGRLPAERVTYAAWRLHFLSQPGGTPDPQWLRSFDRPAEASAGLTSTAPLGDHNPRQIMVLPPSLSDWLSADHPSYFDLREVYGTPWRPAL